MFQYNGWLTNSQSGFHSQEFKPIRLCSRGASMGLWIQTIKAAFLLQWYHLHLPGYYHIRPLPPDCEIFSLDFPSKLSKLLERNALMHFAGRSLHQPV